jgi:DNA-binding transcriptional regulator YhcF (GntR family)
MSIKRNGVKYNVRKYIKMTGNFTQIPNDIFIIIDNLASFKVYCYLCKMYNRDMQYAFPTIEQIANDCSIGTATAKRAIKELKELKLIEILKFEKKTSRYVNNSYRIFYPILDLDSITDEIEEKFNSELELSDVENFTYEITDEGIQKVEEDDKNKE